MPPRRKRQSVLATWIGRKRRESLGSSRSVRRLDTGGKKEKPRKLRDAFAVVMASIRRIDTSKLSGESDSLIDRLKDIKVTADRLDERDAKSKVAGKRNRSLLKRKVRGVGALRGVRRAAGALPAVLALVLCGSAIVEWPSESETRRIRHDETLRRATDSGKPEQVEMVLENLIAAPDASAFDRTRYLRHLLNHRQFEKARRFVRSLPHDNSERSGELQLTAAEALRRFGLSDDRARDEFESRVVIAVADPATTAAARAELGRFYREIGQFEASEAILEPIRATEAGCLELALLRHAQGQFGDIPTTLAPYMVRWREKWLAPKDASDIETSAEALILMNQESVVIETLDEPSVPIAAETVDAIRARAIESLIGRELKSGGLRLWDALAEIDRHYRRLPCSNVWIEPLRKLCSPSAPTRERAMEKRESIVFGGTCPPTFLNAFTAAAIEDADLPFAEKLAQSTIERFPDDPEASELLARVLIEKKPGDFDRALSLIDSALRIDPNRSRAITLRGRVHESRGEFEKAAADYRAAIAWEPRNAELHVALVRVLRKLGREDQARIHEQLARELAPGG